MVRRREDEGEGDDVEVGPRRCLNCNDAWLLYLRSGFSSSLCVKVLSHNVPYLGHSSLSSTHGELIGTIHFSPLELHPFVSKYVCFQGN